MSDTNTDTETNLLPEDYTPREIAVNDLGSQTLDDAFDASMVQVEDGQLVAGSVVKIDREEVLLDIGFKSEGVIPRKELSIRNDVPPSELVSLGDQLEALVIQKEDKEGRLILSKKRAQYEKAWGDEKVGRYNVWDGRCRVQGCGYVHHETHPDQREGKYYRTYRFCY